MSSFVRIKRVATYEKVVYYSVVLTDSDEEEVLNNTTHSLFEDFINRMATKSKEKLNHIVYWLREIGEKRGANIEDFRPERSASALPPKGKDREPLYIENGENTPNDLRLYCSRLNKHVVFLFNGDIKTKNKAQDCPQVGAHYKLANKLAILIDEQIKTNDIVWIKEHTDIDFDDELIMKL